MACFRSARPRALKRPTTQRAKLAVGADFGEAINRHVEVYLAGGWQEEVPEGLKGHVPPHQRRQAELFGESFRPYILMGAGVMHIRLPEMLDLEGQSQISRRGGRRPGHPGRDNRLHRHRLPLLQAVQLCWFHTEWRVRRVRLSLLKPTIAAPRGRARSRRRALPQFCRPRASVDLDQGEKQQTAVKLRHARPLSLHQTNRKPG